MNLMRRNDCFIVIFFISKTQYDDMASVLTIPDSCTRRLDALNQQLNKNQLGSPVQLAMHMLTDVKRRGCVCVCS